MGFRSAVVGLVGSLLGCVGVSWLRYVIAGTLRVDDVSLPLSARLTLGVCFGLCAAVCARCFLALHEQAPTLRCTLLVALSVHSLTAFALPLTSNDVFSNLAYGKLAALGHNPYLEAPNVLPRGDALRGFVGSRWIDARIVYGPVLAYVCRLFGNFDSVVWAFAVWKVIILGVTLASVLAAYMICRCAADSPCVRGAFVLFALAPVMVWELSGQAHNDAILVFAMSVFAFSALCGRQWSAAVSGSIAVWAKFAAAPALFLYMLFIFRQSRIRALLMAVLVVCLGLLAMWPYWHGYATVRAPLAAVYGGPSHTARSFIDLVCLCAEPLGARAQRSVFWAMWLCGLSFLTVLGLRLAARTRSIHDAFHGALILTGAYCVLTAPWFQPWYVTWLLPLGLVDRSRQWQRLVALYAALAPIQYAIPADPVTTAVIDVFIVMRFLVMTRARSESNQTLAEREYSA